MPNVAENELVEQGGIPPADFHDCIERLREIAKYDLEIPADLQHRLSEAIKGLVIPDDLIRAATAALAVGHLVIQGPPGTGKSSLIRALAKAYNASTYAVTAHEDWTIYDVIGRLELRLTDDRKEEITPVNGALTESVIRCGNNVVKHFDDPSLPQGEWLFIDELNRAHLDKAFGELFSVLGTDDLVPINLPHQPVGNRELVIPRRFRIVATLNSYDKQFVQGLSQAIRRRFTFLSLDVPARRPAESPWQYNPASHVPALREFSEVVRRASQRVARREADAGQAEALADTIRSHVIDTHLALVTALFDLVERVRYATRDSEIPYLPIGTAQIVDVVELFVTRSRIEPGDATANARHMDWAAAVKLAPLFESDILSTEKLAKFADSLSAPFTALLRRELRTIAASGMYFVD